MQNFVKKILFISPFIPYPLNSGGNQAVFSMIDYLRKIHSVSILIRAGHQKDIDALKRVWPDVGFFIYSKKEGKRKSWLPLRAHVLHCLSSSFTRKYNRIFFKYWPSRPNVDKMLRIRTLINLRPSELDPGYCEFVHNVAESGFDIIQTEFRELLDMCYFLPENAVKVYVQHEIDYIRRGNELAMLQSPTLMDIARYQQAKDKENESAKKSLETAASLEPNNCDIRYNLALVYELSGDIERAKTEYYKVLELSPNHPEAKNNLKLLGEDV